MMEVNKASWLELSSFQALIAFSRSVRVRELVADVEIIKNRSVRSADLAKNL
jgi:hypothetical protein